MSPPGCETAPWRTLQIFSSPYWASFYSVVNTACAALTNASTPGRCDGHSSIHYEENCDPRRVCLLRMDPCSPSVAITPVRSGSGPSRSPIPARTSPPIMVVPTINGLTLCCRSSLAVSSPLPYTSRLDPVRSPSRFVVPSSSGEP